MEAAKTSGILDTLKSFKTILTRNAILAILINISAQFTNQMRIGFRSLLGNSIGMTGTAIGLAFSIFTIAAVIMRVPSGGVADAKRDKLKYILAGALALKVLIFALFAFVKTPVMYYLVYIIDGAVYSFTGTIIPVILATSVDRRAMGSAYSIYMGLMLMANAPARALSIRLFNEKGQVFTALTTAAIAVIPVILALCLDGTKLYVKSSARKDGAVPAKKRTWLSGLNMQVLPLAICCGLCIFPNTVDGNITALHAESMQFTYLGTLMLGQSIYGVMTIVSGFLCDIISPAILIVISLVGMMTGFTMMGAATTSGIFCAGIIIYQITRYWNSPFKIIGMKAVANKEQGSFQATMLIVTDIVTIFASTIAGMVADAVGYSGAYYLTAAVLLFTLILFLWLKKSGSIDARSTAE